MNTKCCVLLVILALSAATLTFLTFFIQPVSAQELNPQYECPYCVTLWYGTDCYNLQCTGNPQGPHLHYLHLRCYDCETHQYYEIDEEYCSFTC